MAKIILEGLSNAEARNLVNGGYFDTDNIQYELEQSSGLSLNIDSTEDVKSDEDGDDIHTITYTISEEIEDEEEEEDDIVD